MRRRIILEGEKSGGRYVIDGHEVVDLVLPSGTLWATCNVGASSETSYGDYYRYGLGSSAYTSSQSSYTGTENPLSTSRDTAYRRWGSGWRMPTLAQFQELSANTSYEYVTDFNGKRVSGGVFTSTADTTQYMFIPCAGAYDNGALVGVGQLGFVWSSTPNGSYAYRMYVQSGRYIDSPIRSYGCSVRPVKHQ